MNRETDTVTDITGVCLNIFTAEESFVSQSITVNYCKYADCVVLCCCVGVLLSVRSSLFVFTT